MKRTHLLLSSFALFNFLLVSCQSDGGKNNPPAIEKLFTVTWKNYDGTTLETDKDVKKGAIPTYDGTTPTKPSDTEFTYTFKGWDPEVAPATQNQIYTATYTSEKIINEDEKYAKKPMLSEDGKTIKYGLYPQTNVNDEALVANLNSLTNKEPNGWYLYNGEYYAKLIATPRNDNYKFDNGTLIVKKTTYWFKCEPIVWNVLSNNDGEYYVLSRALLDVGQYFSYPSNRTIDGQTITASNYKYSDIRKWLNADFYNSAFALNNSHIETTNVDNSAATTKSDTNTYICEDTQDKVFLPSYKDYTNSSYGFYKAKGATETRCSKATDWTRARGVSLATQTGEYAYNGYYWTRSPDSERPSFVCYAGYDGWLKHDYVHAEWMTYRPALTIKIS